MKRNNKTAQNKEKIKKIVLFIFMMLIGAIGGFLWGYMLPSSDTESSMDIIKLAISIGIFILAFFIQIILHEAGHLICGLLSGYEFVSFRVGSLTLVKEDGKFSIKKFSIKGTGGQCLLMPKNDNYKECSYILYNLGGILMNLIVSIIFFILYMVFKGNSYVYIALISMVITGILIFITNGVPMKISGVANDGYNLVSIIKNDLMKYCFYMQLKVNGLLHKGIRIKDMPLEWFLIDKNADFSNPLVCSIKCLEANYYHDKLEFDKAKDCYEFLLNYSPKIIPLYENE
ncbi:MAG: site-2 protease family protein, partial [Peptostreptococcaceae bacterium]|nr:site-2 protease family protein [Peptostreptococcaceae bacterium]